MLTDGLGLYLRFGELFAFGVFRFIDTDSLYGIAVFIEDIFECSLLHSFVGDLNIYSGMMPVENNNYNDIKYVSK